MTINDDFERFSRLMLDEFKRVHDRFDMMGDRFDNLQDQNGNLAKELAEIRRSLSGLDDAVGNIAGFAKEIDHLLRRVGDIEKHLGLNRHIRA